MVEDALGRAPTLIYCARGNNRFAQIAIEAGYRYGARLPDTVYHPLYFADQDWKHPRRDKYMQGLAQHRPHMATVLDWEREDQLADVLDWAEEAAQFVDQVVIIPKVPGGIPRLPLQIGPATVVLGYSVPTKYGGTPLPLWAFAGRPVHLLGGSPHAQMECWRYLAPIAQVVSADGNMAQMMATRYCQFWTPGTARRRYRARNRYWPTIREANGGTPVEGTDLPYKAFRLSCANIKQAWEELCQ
ncbi:MAG: hypothetical protein P8189_18040 [Anaerolineae bacterium]